jgi:cobalt-zinc-cadmium resistance protein CzcA
VGERSVLEKTLIENNYYELRNTYTLESENLKQAFTDLQFLLVTEEEITPQEDTLLSLVMPSSAGVGAHPSVRVLQEELQTREAESALEKSLLFPEVSVGYFRQNITETDVQFKGLQGWTLEIAIPLWIRPQQASIQRARLRAAQASEQLDLRQQQITTEREKAASEIEKYQKTLAYYHDLGLEHASVIRRTATLQMEAGEIDFFQYLQSLQRYTQTRLQYFETLRNYNLSIIRFEYLGE